MEHLDVRQREVEGGERGQHQARIPGPPGGMAGDAPVHQVDQQAHVRPAVCDRIKVFTVGTCVFSQVGVSCFVTNFFRFSA